MKLSLCEKIIKNHIQHFDEVAYFKRYRRVTSYTKDKGIIERLICEFLLLRIKKMDAFNRATLGAHLDYGVDFGSNGGISLPHGIRGITITHGIQFGKNCTLLVSTIKINHLLCR